MRTYQDESELAVYLALDISPSMDSASQASWNTQGASQRPWVSLDWPGTIVYNRWPSAAVIHSRDE